MTGMWWAWITGYVAVLLLLHRGWKSDRNRSFWTFPEQKSAWWLAISLASSSFSISTAGLISSTIGHYGPDGVFFLWSGLLGIGIFPIVFAPLWSKLQFISENEFILMRFHGDWSRRLFRFRSILLSGLVIPILLAFILVATRDLLEAFVPWNRNWMLVGLGASLGIVGWNASLYAKSRLDMVHFILLLAVIVLALGAVFSGPKPMLPAPSSTPGMLPFEFVIFVGLQWWSAELLDGSGIHAQSLLKQRSMRIAIRGALGGHALTFVIGAVIAVVTVYAHQVGGLRGDGAYLQGFRWLLPEPMHPLLAIALFGMGMSTASAFMNWGSGMMVALFQPNSKNEKQLLLGRGVLVGLAIWSTCIAYHMESLFEGIQWILAITAGVGPVFILRWYWWRITAQVQLAAMLGVYLWVPISHHLVNIIPAAEPVQFAAVLALATTLNTCWWLIIACLTNGPVDREQFTTFRTHVRAQLSKNQLAQVIGLGGMAFALVLLLRQVLMEY